MSESQAPCADSQLLVFPQFPPPPGGCSWLHERFGSKSDFLLPRLLAVGSGQAPALCASGQKRTGAPASRRRRGGTRRASLPCRVGPHTSSSWAHPKAASVPPHYPVLPEILRERGSWVPADAQSPPTAPTLQPPGWDYLVSGVLWAATEGLWWGAGVARATRSPPTPSVRRSQLPGLSPADGAGRVQGASRARRAGLGSGKVRGRASGGMHLASVSMEDVRDVGSDPWVGKIPWHRKDPSEEEIATHFSVLAWKIPCSLQKFKTC